MMAKISANGAIERARFRSRETGSFLLMRSDGAVLYKSSVEGDGWHLFLKVKTEQIDAWIQNIRRSPNYEVIQ